MQKEREGKEMKEMVAFFLFGWHKRKKEKGMITPISA